MTIVQQIPPTSTLVTTLFMGAPIYVIENQSQMKRQFQYTMKLSEITVNLGYK